MPYLTTNTKMIAFVINMIIQTTIIVRCVNEQAIPRTDHQ